MKFSTIALIVAVLLAAVVVVEIVLESSDCDARGGVMVRTPFNGVRCIGGRP